MTFPSIARLSGFRHRFTLRHPQVDVKGERQQVIERLRTWHAAHVEEMGFPPDGLRTAAQVHGNHVEIISQISPNEEVPGCDGMITRLPRITLGIYVADCCAVYLADPMTGAFGVVHSGKNGTAARITENAINLMVRHFGSDPAHMIVQLSPCIRPPAYEIDFAADIRRQALESDILPHNLHDTGICTSSDLTRFYSYRMEKGRTGRMMALIGRDE